MSDILLQTKFQFPPLRKELVPRLELLERLDAGLWRDDAFACRLTLISAPAGYGKTTLVASWLHGVEPNVAWLSLDEDEADPARFLTYLVAVLNQIDPAIGSTVEAMMASPRSPPAEILLTVLVNDIKSHAPPFILVLDDFHVLKNPATHLPVAFLLENQPAQMHLVICTRTDPPLQLHKLRAGGQMSEIRQSDLSFSNPEAAHFLRRIMGLNLSAEDVNALRQRTEGWVTGLQLAALSMHRQTDRQQFVRDFTGSNRYILDYLFEEVLRLQTAHVQEFLLKTSILDQLTAPLCDAVTGHEGSQELLETLEADNLFIIPLDQSRVWFRYHHLFADLLQHQMRLLGDQSIARLHQRASQWHEDNRTPAKAVQHALAALDWDRANQLIRQISGDMLRRGEVVTLLTWFGKFPVAYIHSQPKLSYEYSWPLLLSGQFDAAEPFLKVAESACENIPSLSGQVAAAQAYLARSRGDVPGTIEYSQIALSHLPETDLVARGNIAVNLGIAYWHTGQMAEAESMLDKAYLAALKSDNHYGRLAAQVFLARVSAVRGELHQAAVMFKDMLNTAGEIPIAALVFLDLGELHYEWDDLEGCEEYLSRGRAIAVRSNNLEFQVAADILQVRLSLAQGKIGDAIATLERSQRQISDEHLQPPTRGRRMACQAELAMSMSDFDRAWNLSNQAGVEVDAHSFYRFSGLLSARLRLRGGNRRAAAYELEKCVHQAEKYGWGYGLVAARVFQALAASDPNEGLEYLKIALHLGQSGGYIRTFVEAGRTLKPLLEEAALSGIFPEYVGRILTTTKREVGSGTNKPSKGKDYPVEELSARELEVLRLVAAGMSNREIAGKLVLSLGTVKSHIHNIYGKLGVRNRTQAVSRGRELELL